MIGRGCDDGFWVLGSQDSAIQVIKEVCKITKEETNEK